MKIHQLRSADSTNPPTAKCLIQNPPTAVWIDSSWWIFRKGISQLVEFSEKHFAAGGFLLGGIDVSLMRRMEIIRMHQCSNSIKTEFKDLDKSNHSIILVGYLQRILRWLLRKQKELCPREGIILWRSPLVQDLVIEYTCHFDTKYLNIKKQALLTAY